MTDPRTKNLSKTQPKTDTSTTAPAAKQSQQSMTNHDLAEYLDKAAKALQRCAIVLDREDADLPLVHAAMFTPLQQVQTIFNRTLAIAVKRLEESV